ncbi:MAG: hypothetical protein IPL46_21955 [Saprospiraceae bacterium]|nr:hypothetical protein [Saprospiraceae bacterium]
MTVTNCIVENDGSAAIGASSANFFYAPQGNNNVNFFGAAQAIPALNPGQTHTIGIANDFAALANGTYYFGVWVNSAGNPAEGNTDDNYPSWNAPLLTLPVGAAQGYTCATAFELTQPGTFNAPGPSQGNGAIAGGPGTHANWYRFTPPMTGMINILTCGLAGAGNQHNHVYTVNTGSCATLNINDVVYTEDRGCTQNQADGVKLENVPVTMGVPIYIEWDDALSSNSFTWTLEYQGGGGCMANVTVNAAAMGNTLASNSIATQNAVTINGAAVFSAPNVNLNAGFEVPAGNCFEANNVGCGYNGVLMCDGGGGGAGTCASPQVINCGQAYQGDNTGGDSNWSSYQAGNFDGLTGPEKIHTLIIPGNTTRTISLSGLNDDLDLVIATACDPATVFDGSATIGDETVVVNNNTANPVTYYIIVDGWNGATSTYTLSCN